MTETEKDYQTGAKTMLDAFEARYASLTEEEYTVLLLNSITLLVQSVSIATGVTVDEITRRSGGNPA